jgi:hypothetical protein
MIKPRMKELLKKFSEEVSTMSIQLRTDFLVSNDVSADESRDLLRIAGLVLHGYTDAPIYLQKALLVVAGLDGDPITKEMIRPILLEGLQKEFQKDLDVPSTGEGTSETV